MVKNFRPLTALAKALFFWIPNLKIIVSNDDMDDQTRARKQKYGETKGSYQNATFGLPAFQKHH